MGRDRSKNEYVVPSNLAAKGKNHVFAVLGAALSAWQFRKI
jgi:hypothetical protein